MLIISQKKAYICVYRISVEKMSTRVQTFGQEQQQQWRREELYSKYTHDDVEKQ